MPEKRDRYNISLLPDTINKIKNEAQAENIKESEYIEKTIEKYDEQKYQTEEQIDEEIEEYKRKLINAMFRKQNIIAQKKLNETKRKLQEICEEQIKQRREEIDNKLEEIKKYSDPVKAEEETNKIIKTLREDAKEFGMMFTEYINKIDRKKELQKHTIQNI